MTAKEIKQFYFEVSTAYNRKDLNEFEAKSWQMVLAGYELSALEAALREWQADTVIEEFSGRARGARMPAAAEMKAVVEKLRHQHLATVGKFVACRQNGCMDGWRPVSPEQFSRYQRCQCLLDHIAARKG